MMTLPWHKLLTVFALGLLACGNAAAGLLVLDNGDRITGELVGLSGGNLVWQSSMMGTLTVPQIHVARIESRGLFEIELDARRELNECQVQVDTSQQLLNCAQGFVTLPSWRLVQRISGLPLPQRDQWRHTGHVAVTGRRQTGNNPNRRINIDTRLELRRSDQRHHVALELNREKSAGIRVYDQRIASYRFDHFFSPRWFYGTEFAWGQNRFTDLEDRYTVGVSIGHQFFDTELVRLSFQFGPIYRKEHFIQDADRDYIGLSTLTDFSWRLNSLGLEFFHRNTLLRSVEESDDWEIDSDTGFRLPVLGRLNARAQFEYDYDNIPAEGAEPEDSIWSVGLSYDF